MWPLTRIERTLRAILRKQTRPVGFHFRLKERIREMLVYSLTCAPAVDADVITRKLTITVNGEGRNPVQFPASFTNLGEFAFADDDNVVLTLCDVDDAGNASEPAVLEFVAKDTIAPAKPGEFGVTLVREE